MKQSFVCVLENGKYGRRFVTSGGEIVPFLFPVPWRMLMGADDATRIEKAFAPKHGDMKTELLVMELIPARRAYLRPLPAPQLENVK